MDTWQRRVLGKISAQEGIISGKNVGINQLPLSFQQLGDVGFDEREILRDTTHLEDPLYKSTDMRGEAALEDHEKTLTNDDRADQKAMDINLEPPVVGDGFGDGVGDGFMGKVDFWPVEGGDGVLILLLFEDFPICCCWKSCPFSQVMLQWLKL